MRVEAGETSAVRNNSSDALPAPDFFLKHRFEIRSTTTPLIRVFRFLGRDRIFLEPPPPFFVHAGFRTKFQPLHYLIKRLQSFVHKSFAIVQFCFRWLRSRHPFLNLNGVRDILHNAQRCTYACMNKKAWYGSLFESVFTPVWDWCASIRKWTFFFFFEKNTDNKITGKMANVPHPVFTFI